MLKTQKKVKVNNGTMAIVHEFKGLAVTINHKISCKPHLTYGTGTLNHQLFKF